MSKKEIMEHLDHINSDCRRILNESCEWWTKIRMQHQDRPLIIWNYFHRLKNLVDDLNKHYKGIEDILETGIGTCRLCRKPFLKFGEYIHHCEV